MLWNKPRLKIHPLGVKTGRKPFVISSWVLQWSDDRSFELDLFVDLVLVPTADETGQQTKSNLEYGVKGLETYRCEKLNDIRGFQIGSGLELSIVKVIGISAFEDWTRSCQLCW